jgi:hypothetical protein
MAAKPTEPPLRRAATVLLLVSLLSVVGGCRTPPRPGTAAPREGDEIVVAGRFIHTGAPVVTWLDPGGYDAYRVERRFSPLGASDWETSRQEVEALKTPNRYGPRRDRLPAEEVERVRGGGWDFGTLTNLVDQFVIHYDACGTSRQCFKVLHDLRGLSVHFLLDLDGTIYQTLDLKERAWHATTSNTRSVGIEMAQIGACPTDRAGLLESWYAPDPAGGIRITLPAHLGDGGVRTPGFVGRPARADLVRGSVQGIELVQYDFTPEQYRALVRLTATLCRVFPRIRCDYPRDAAGQVIPHQLEEGELAAFEGILGHWHIQANKVDPGPAFQWDRVLTGARELLANGVHRRLESPKGASLR